MTLLTDICPSRVGECEVFKAATPLHKGMTAERINMNVKLYWWENTSEWEEQYNDMLLDFLTMQPAETFSNESVIHLYWDDTQKPKRTGTAVCLKVSNESVESVITQKPEQTGIAVCLKERDACAEKAVSENVDGESAVYDEQCELELFTAVLEDILLTKKSERTAKKQAHRAYWAWREKVQADTVSTVLHGLNKRLVTVEEDSDITNIVSIGEYSFSVTYYNLQSLSDKEKAHSIANALDGIRMGYYPGYAYYMAYLKERGC